MDRRQAVAGRLCLAALALSAVTAAAQQPTFRSSVDLIAVDVQVVDRTGVPIPQLTADRFDVQIDGGRRKVVSADFIDEQHGSRGRTYVLGIDVGSINVVESRTLIEGAREFIRRLRPED